MYKLVNMYLCKLFTENRLGGARLGASISGYVIHLCRSQWLCMQESVINDVLLADQPTKRFVKPQEIGALVRHLCSDDSQSFQGACISIDGGWTAR